MTDSHKVHNHFCHAWTPGDVQPHAVISGRVGNFPYDTNDCVLLISGPESWHIKTKSISMGSLVAAPSRNPDQQGHN